MKLSQKQQILKHAEAHPEGFKAADLAYTGIKRGQIARQLWDMKKKKLLVHNRNKHTYKMSETNSQTVKVSAPPKPKQDSKAAQEVDYYRRLFDSLSGMHEALEEKYEDSLAIIRYLENKLLIAIQHDAKHSANT